MKNTHGAVKLLAMLQAKTWNSTKCNTPPWVLFTFLNSTNGTKSHKASELDYEYFPTER